MKPFSFGLMLTKPYRLVMGFVFNPGGALFQQCLVSSGSLHRADIGGYPAVFCPPLPHGQSLFSRRGRVLSPCVSASCLPHFTAELAK